MRCICPTLALCLALLLSGCRTQTAALKNPFLSPDRVPPPPTRTLVPGTAQPYYPGDPVPNSPAGMPPGALPTYAPQGSPVVPPRGWNSVPQAGVGLSPHLSPIGNTRQVSGTAPLGIIVTVGEAPVRVQSDEHNIRFAQPPTQYETPNPPSYPTQNPAQSFVVQQQQVTPTPAAVQPQTPAQFLAPPGIAPNVLSPPAYPGQLTGYQEPVADPRAVRLRAVPPGQQPSANGALSPVTRDGFRPQGSSRNRSAARPTSDDTLSGRMNSAENASSRFGFDPNYQWIRGQVEFSEATGQWTLRYIPIQESLDQFGGSVLIANPQLLGGVRPGEHLLLRGRLHTRGNSGQTFAPIYTISVVQRQQI